ncbi:MAG: hypothetical protein AAFW74_00420 [Pseudomonadota bacterium]
MGINKVGSIDAAVVIAASLVPVPPTRDDVPPSPQLSVQITAPNPAQDFFRRRYEHV